VLDAAINIAGWRGVDVGERYPFFWLIYIVLFIVWIPAVVLQNRPSNSGGKKSGATPSMAPYAPWWLRMLTSALAVYLAINVVLFIATKPSGSPAQDGKGGYVLLEHGRVIRAITPAEYHLYKAHEVRAISGHTLVFFSAALMVLVSARRQSQQHAPWEIPPHQKLPPKQPAERLNYGRALPSWAPPIWLHATLRIMSMMVGWMGGPILIAVFVMPHLPKGYFCPMAILFFGAALFCAIVPARLLTAHVPARCPTCGGRAFRAPGEPRRYICRDCGAQIPVSA